jgi:hypothetical protein
VAIKTGSNIRSVFIYFKCSDLPLHCYMLDLNTNVGLVLFLHYSPKKQSLSLGETCNNEERN